MKTTTVSQWEAAWAEYVDALSRLDQAQTLRFMRGGARPFNAAKQVCKKARLRLVSLDREFCDRMGIGA